MGVATLRWVRYGMDCDRQGSKQAGDLAREEKSMKIDEGCIDHNVVQLITAMVGVPFEYSDPCDDADHTRLVTLGYIYGAIRMGEALKEVLKV